MRVVLEDPRSSGLRAGKKPLLAGHAPLVGLNDGEILVGLFVLRTHALYAKLLEMVLLCEALAGTGYVIVKSVKLCAVDAGLAAVNNER